MAEGLNLSFDLFRLCFRAILRLLGGVEHSSRPELVEYLTIIIDKRDYHGTRG